MRWQRHVVTGQVNFHPCMQIGDIMFRTGPSIDGPNVSSQLDQVAGLETRGDAKMAQNLHQQPR
jgi:hypothetical protein